MKDKTKVKKTITNIYIFNFDKSLHSKWNKRRRFGM